jgi:glycosyltransferase involved in cell wall biosynthesis
MSPLFSVVIASYNYGRFIEEALQSVESQRFDREQIEIIVVDDGSTDDTAARVAKFPRATYILQAHAGQGAAFNRGIAAARGEVVLLLDADDTWAPEKAQCVADAFRKHPDAGLVQHRMADTPQSAMNHPLVIEPSPEVVQTRDDFLSGRIDFTGTSGLAFSRTLLLNLPQIPAPLVFCADEFLYVRAALQAPVLTLPFFLGKRRIHGGNFYAAALKSTEKLHRKLDVRRVLDETFARDLASAGFKLSPSAERQLAMERLRDEVLCLALDGKEREALSLVDTEAGKAGQGGYQAFKKASLKLAARAPRLYIFLLEHVYQRLGFLAAVRRRILPERKGDPISAFGRAPRS